MPAADDRPDPRLYRQVPLPAPTTDEPGHPDPLALAQAPQERRRLGPYRVLRVLGRGGMGVVLLAEDPALGRQVALKVMNPAQAGRPEARRRFQAEARAMAAVEHDHIVPIHHVGEDAGTPFLVMPLLRGESLDARLRREGRLAPAEAARVARQMALGLQAAHQRGLIHRDVKPANVWLEEGTGRVKLLDFGLARAAEPDVPGQTAAGALVGTPAYMAPEQARGGPVDARADLFSLGAVLYRLCAGRPPFGGADAMGVLAALAAENPAPPAEVDPAVPPRLSALVMRLLAKDAAARPPMAEVLEELRSLEQGPAAPGRKRLRVWALGALGAAAVLAGVLVLALPLPRPHGGTGSVETEDEVSGDVGGQVEGGAEGGKGELPHPAPKRPGKKPAHGKRKHK